MQLQEQVSAQTSSVPEEVVVRTSSLALELAQDVADDFILGLLIHIFGLLVHATCRFLSRTPHPESLWK